MKKTKKGYLTVALFIISLLAKAFLSLLYILQSLICATVFRLP
jgi:hypothetical protein